MCSRARIVDPLGFDEAPLFRVVVQVSAEPRGGARACESVRGSRHGHLGADQDESAEKESRAGEENDVRLPSLDHRDHQAVGDASGDGEREPEERRAGRRRGGGLAAVDDVGLPSGEAVAGVPRALACRGCSSRLRPRLRSGPRRVVGAEGAPGRCARASWVAIAAPSRRVEGRRAPPRPIGEGQATGRGEGRRGESRRIGEAVLVCSVGRRRRRKAGAEERAAEDRRGHDADGGDGAHGG